MVTHGSIALTNDQWIDNKDEVADPTPLPTLKGYHVLVRPVTVKPKTKGGLIIPDALKDDIAYLTTVGRVLKLGELAYYDADKFPNGKWCDVGDTVAFAKHAGQKIMFKGVRLLMLYDDQIMMSMEDATDLDTSFNLSN